MSALATAAAAATAAGAATRAHGARGCSPSSDPSLLHAAGSDVIFRKATSLEALNASSRNTAMAALGLVFTEIGDDYVRGPMPVEDRQGVVSGKSGRVRLGLGWRRIIKQKKT